MSHSSHPATMSLYLCQTMDEWTGTLWGVCGGQGMLQEEWELISLYEMSRGLDRRWNVRVYIHILHEMLHSWALWSNPIDAGMRLPGKKSSLLH